jgi:hypothetical protein
MEMLPHVQLHYQWQTAQNVSIVASVVAENVSHFVKLKTYKYVNFTALHNRYRGVNGYLFTFWMKSKVSTL